MSSKWINLLKKTHDALSNRVGGRKLTFEARNNYHVWQNYLSELFREYMKQNHLSRISRQEFKEIMQNEKKNPQRYKEYKKRHLEYKRKHFLDSGLLNGENDKEYQSMKKDPIKFKERKDIINESVKNALRKYSQEELKKAYKDFAINHWDERLQNEYNQFKSTPKKKSPKKLSPIKKVPDTPMFSTYPVDLIYTPATTPTNKKKIISPEEFFSPGASDTVDTSSYIDVSDFTDPRSLSIESAKTASPSGTPLRSATAPISFSPGKKFRKTPFKKMSSSPEIPLHKKGKKNKYLITESPNASLSGHGIPPLLIKGHGTPQWAKKKLSAYNLFVKDMFQHEYAKGALHKGEIGNIMKKIAEQWYTLKRDHPEEAAIYFKEAGKQRKRGYVLDPYQYIQPLNIIDNSKPILKKFINQKIKKISKNEKNYKQQRQKKNLE